MDDRRTADRILLSQVFSLDIDHCTYTHADDDCHIIIAEVEPSALPSISLPA